MSGDATGLAFAFFIQPDGSVSSVELDELSRTQPTSGILWLHLDLRHPDATKWLEQESGLDPIEIDALLADATRPRFTLLPHGVLLNVRGLISNHGEDTADTVSVRCWLEEHRIITASRLPSNSVEQLVILIRDGGKVHSAGGLAGFLAELSVEDIGTYVEVLEEELDSLNDTIDTAPVDAVRESIHGLQRKALSLRRYIAPQQLALSQFSESEIGWLPERPRRRLMEAANEVARLVEALNFVWERARVLHDDLQIRGGAETNRRLYLLSILSGVFLPLTFVTGLLGVNVGGIPGASAENAFWILCILMLVLGGAFGWWMKRSRWL